MKSFKIAMASVVALLLLLMPALAQSQFSFHSNPFYFPLSQHRMTFALNQFGEPIYSQYTFDIDDVEAISWLKVWRNHEDHTVEWRWYSPDGHVYHRTFGVIPAIDGPLGHWGSNIWSSLKIDGYEVSVMPGTWHVDVIVDFKKEVTEYFSIGTGGQAPCN